MNKDNIVDEIKSQNKWEIVHSGQFTNRDALMLNGQKVIVLEHYTEEPQRDKIKGNIIEALSKYDTVVAQNKCLLEALKESYLELECIKIKSTATIRAHRIIKEAISKANETI